MARDIGTLCVDMLIEEYKLFVTVPTVAQLSLERITG